jgi:transposase
MEGRHCPLAARGYSRDGRKGKLQIEYGLLTDPEGRPVAVRVFPGNTGDPAAFTAIVKVVRDKFGLAKMVMVGDRGMITSARIQAMNQQDDGTARPDAETCEWITALQDRQALRRHHHRHHPDGYLRQDRIDAEAALDGFYVLRTPVPADELGAAAVVTAYKNLKYVERDFRHIKSDDLDLRPVFHRLEERVKAHVLICMLACYLTWHLRRAWAPLTFTDPDPPAQDNPVTPARRSARAQASGQHDPAGQPYHSFGSLLDHLATLTRNQVRFAGTRAAVPVLAEPTSAQREAFELIGVPIPLTLK